MRGSEVSYSAIHVKHQHQYSQHCPAFFIKPETSQDCGRLGRMTRNGGGKSISSRISYLKPDPHASDCVLLRALRDIERLKNNHVTVVRNKTNPDTLATADSQSAA